MCLDIVVFRGQSIGTDSQTLLDLIDSVLQKYSKDKKSNYKKKTKKHLAPPKMLLSCPSSALRSNTRKPCRAAAGGDSVSR